MRLIHQDGRPQTVQDAAYQRHEATYTRAGWRPARNQNTGDDEGVVGAAGIKIRSLHNAEKTVTEAEFAEVYEPAGWTRLDAKAESGEAESANAADAKPAKATDKKGA